MKYITASSDMADAIHHILHTTIKTVYPNFYEHRGYHTVGHGIYELEQDVKLVYEIMERAINRKPHSHLE